MGVILAVSIVYIVCVFYSSQVMNLILTTEPLLKQKKILSNEDTLIRDMLVSLWIMF